MMHSFMVMMAIYTVRGVIGLANYYMAFEYFFVFPSSRWKKAKGICVGIYFLINYLYRPMINYGPRVFHYVIWMLYLVRIVPFLWAKYGYKKTYLAIVLFYGNIIDCIAQNIHVLFTGNIFDEKYSAMNVDFSAMVTEALVFCILFVLIILKRVNFIKVYFTKLTIIEYMLLFGLDMSFAILEASIFKSSLATSYIKKVCIVTYIFLMALIIHAIMVRNQNTSMNAMIGNLKEPMKQIKDSYIEMNEKNTELRRFRHDVKNLLITLRSLVSEGKNTQAVEYIDKMQGAVEKSNVKLFDTGNFIADALLESKFKVAVQNNIYMTVTGNIPANRIEDVSLVILISNLLDNAIEAAKRVDGERKIEIQSILKKSVWILSVKNSCVQDVVIRENRIDTTKDNKEAHGFGLSNIERVTKNYSGKLQLSCKDKVFTARTTIMLAV